MHRFVSVALHTSAGEGDLSSDRLSHLKVVGSGFGPLIYGLKEDSSFESFSEQCKAVWKAVEYTPKLPSLLVCYYVYYNQGVSLKGWQGSLPSWSETNNQNKIVS